MSDSFYVHAAGTGDLGGTATVPLVEKIQGVPIAAPSTGGGATTNFLRAHGSLQAPAGGGGGGGTVGVAGGGTGDTALTAYAPLTGGTTTTGAVQQATQGMGTAWSVLSSQGSSAVPVWGPPVLPASDGGLWVLGVDTGGGLYTLGALQDETNAPIDDQNSALIY
jgi:hypothetical protein